MSRSLVAWSLRVLGVAVALALVLGVRTARADNPALQKAQALYNDATAALAAKKYDDAADGYKKAYDAMPIVDLLYNIGATYHLKARESSDVAAYELAQQYYGKYLEAAPASADKPDIDKRLEVIIAEIARLKAAPPPEGTPPPPPPPEATAVVVKPRSLVVIETEPQGANIYLDDKTAGVFAQSPWSGALDGQRKVIIEKRGYKSKESTVVPDPNRLVVLQVVLSEEDYLGWVEIKSNVPGASIFADDRSVGAIGVTPFSGNFKPGKHSIWISADGYDDFHQDIEVVAGEAGEVDAQLSGAPVGYLNIRATSTGTTRVSADGARLCDQVPCREPLREGKHKIVLSRGGYKPYRATLDFQARTEVTLRPNLVKKPGRGDAVTAYVFAVLLAGGGTAAYLYADKLQTGDSQFGNKKYIQYGAYGGWGLGGLIGLTAIYYTFRDKGPPSTATIDMRSLALSPAAGPGYAGLDLAGSF